MKESKRTAHILCQQLMGLTIVVLINFTQNGVQFCWEEQQEVYYTASADMLESEDGLGQTVVIYRKEEE